MRKLFILIAIFAIATGATAQLKILPNGNVGIKTNNPTDPLDVAGRFKIRNDGVVSINAETQDWWPAIRTTVPTKKSCAYNLWNSHKDINRDVFYVCGEGWLWAEKGGYFGSDSTLKKNIAPIEGALKKVISLQGVRFQYKDGSDEEDDFRLGFIANDVEQVFPEAVKEIHDGIKAMSYTDLIPVLVEAIKEQQTQIDSLKMMVSNQGNDIILLNRLIDECCQSTPAYSPPKSPTGNNEQGETQHGSTSNSASANENNIPIAAAKLFQNIPNPFSADTEIRFEIPENTTSAKLLIHDMQGAEIKSYSISERGFCSIIIRGSELQAGMYMYTLLVNNTIIDTKKMILTK